MRTSFCDLLEGSTNMTRMFASSAVGLGVNSCSAIPSFALSTLRRGSGAAREVTGGGVGADAASSEEVLATLGRVIGG